MTLQIDDTQEKVFLSEAMDIVRRGKAEALASPKPKLANIVIDHAMLTYCLNVLAHLIHDGDDVYLPIFERIKLELEQLDNERELKDLAKTIVAQSALNAQFNNQTLH